jgi:hypothetical protein
VNGKIDTVHLRQVKLTVFDIKLLGLLSKSGGEYPMPETKEGQDGVETSRVKGLVEIVQRPLERPRVRLTDQGRAVISQLEAMAVQPKVEVVNR